MHPDSTDPQPAVVAVAGSPFDEWLARLGVPLVAAPLETCFLLAPADGLLELRPPGEAARPGVRAQFPPDRAPSTARAHPLVRAFGKRTATILDLTAGLGADAYRLAAAGHRVRACERNAALFAVLSTGWEAARRAGRVPVELAGRLAFVHAEAEELLASLGAEEVGVYLDPMYPPPRRASALPRRELQVLRRLLGEADDPVGLLQSARARAARVVVKRPHHAPPLAAGASFVVESKLLRFDVYLDPRRMGTATA